MNEVIIFLTPFVAVLKSNVALSVVSVLLFIALLNIIFLSQRIQRLAAGKNGASLEGTIDGLQKRSEALEKYALENSRRIHDMERRIQRSVQNISTERFDPFQNASGQQSFATALLNEKGDGVVISGIHARDGVRVYSKEVQTFASERELSEEEERAIEKAKKALTV